MRYLITGGTGLIGRALSTRLLSYGHEVIVLTRKPKKVKNPIEQVEYIGALSDAGDIDVIVNLAGENVFGRWTNRKKDRIVSSRIDTTRDVVDYIANTPKKPKALISGSAIGFYGNDEEKEFAEDSTPNGGFTHNLCRLWEEEALIASEHTRVCLIRTGIVLSKNGGALSQMLPTFKAGLGGITGTGSQYMSWIHIDDIVGLIIHAATDESISGPINGTAPNPVNNADFTRTLCKVLKRPTFVPMPEFVLRGIFGEMADSLLLEGQKVIPKKALDTEYKFSFEVLQDALEDILHNKT